MEKMFCAHQKKGPNQMQNGLKFHFNIEKKKTKKNSFRPIILF